MVSVRKRTVNITKQWYLASERPGQRLHPGLGYADTFGVKQRVALGALQLRYAGDAGAVRRTRREVHHSGPDTRGNGEKKKMSETEN